MKSKTMIPVSLWTIIGLFALLSTSGCVSKNTYQQQLDQNQALQTDLYGTTEKLNNLQSRYDIVEQQLEDALAQNKALNDQNIAAMAEIDRLKNIFQARSQKQQQQLSALEQQQQALEAQQQQQQQRYQQLLDNKQQLEQELERERIAREARLAKMANTYNSLVANLEQEIERGEITINKLKDKLTVNLVEKILFPSGSADLTPAGIKVIRQVGDILKEVDDKDIRVEGHTDNLGISKALQAKFPSNWELSAARAANVVRVLQREVGIPGEKLEIGAYGPFHPVSSNDTPEGRAQNRRIQIVLVPPAET
ncbi:OmpA family protein [uncultured Desulfuromonas sp.]|uniref:OmpA/MotB family protein n=1 Tax=uncultured Desulfuromonas sp. TaxID=181013 RepID=UPI002AAB144D|nr:OmpA family protein [uncultured Desulfuromonas sp.]